MSSQTPSIRLTPNPTSGKLSFESNQSLPGVDVEILDVLGNVVLEARFQGVATGETHWVSLENLPAGAYIFSLQSSQYRFASKIALTK